jgi:hypothetical protein
LLFWKCATLTLVGVVLLLLFNKYGVH